MTLEAQRRLASALFCFAFIAGCGTGSDDGDAGDNGVPGVDAPGELLAHCVYENAFAQSLECREYKGGIWTREMASSDCEDVFFGSAGEFSMGACALPQEIGRCVVGDLSNSGYVTVSTGEPGSCGDAQNGCETFAGGTFEPAEACGNQSCAAPMPPTDATVVPPFLDCRPPLDGEAPGLGADGQVCTQTLISASTEAGRHFPDYASCDIVRRQRPYYAAPPEVNTDPNDPRLLDAEYMGEMAWLTEQARASACTCCHQASTTPGGAAAWDIEAGPLWIDTVSDEALAMFIGLTPSEHFGFYPPEENNGFDRSRTGLPTTDVDRLVAFGMRELERRGISEAEARALDRFAPFFQDLVEHEPEPCSEGIGVGPDGALSWELSSARYITVLEAGSLSPGVFPNWHLPEGTLWALGADPDSPTIGCGMRYGDVPDGANQLFPTAGEPAPLVSGERYYLHVQLDLALPITRCLFVAP